jgi:ribosome biogenesis protein SSF1/2
MNNFTSSQQAQESSSSKPKSNDIPKHLENLTTTIFQSLFPPISPQTTPLSSIRRVLLLNRELPSPKSTDPDSPGTENGAYSINLRHYAITTRSTGLSRSIRRLKAAEKLVTSREKKRKGIPNLGRLEDVADYLLDPSTAASGYTSASETEVETDAEVEVLASTTKKVLSGAQRKKLSQQTGNGNKGGPSGGRNVEKRAIKLVELGPRMRLRMLKVEEGVCSGKVMWHEFLHKTKEEERALEQLWETRRKEKEERRRKQKEDVERKRQEREAGKKKKTDEDGDENMEDDDEDNDEDEYGRQEWDSEGLEGDAEMLLNEEKDEEGEWSDDEEEIAAG